MRHFDLDDPDDQARSADPAFVLKPLTGLVVLDKLYVICYGAGKPWPLAEGIVAVPAMCIASSEWLA